MAKVKLELEADLGSLASALSQGDQLITKTRDGISQLGKETKGAFTVAANQAGKFEQEIKSSTTEVAQLGKTLKATEELFAKGSGVKSAQDQQKAVANVRKELESLLAFEKKLTEEREKAGPSNIKEQFTKQIVEAQKEVKKLTEDLKKMGGGGAGGGGKAAINSVKELKNEIKRLTSEAIQAGHGTEIFTENLRKAGELKDELNDLNAALKSVSGNTTENVGKALAESTELGVKGFEGLIAVQSLFGEENENIEKQILKLQAVQSISRLVSEFGGLKDKLTEIKLAFTPLTNLYTRGNDALKGFIKSGKETDGVAKGAKNLFTSMGTGIKSFVSSGISGIKSLWATIAANPLGVVLVVIGGLIAAMVALKDKIKPIGLLFDFIGKSIDALISPLEKLGQRFGLLATEHEKSAKKIISNTEKEVEAITAYYDRVVDLAAAGEKETKFLEQKKLEAVKKRVDETIEALNFLQKENGKLNDEELEQKEAAEKKLLEISQQGALLRAKEEAKIAKFIKDQQNDVANHKISLIKDDETRERAAAKKRRDDELASASEAVNGVFQRYEEEQKVFNAQSKRIEEAYQKELADIAKKYGEKRAEEMRKNQDKLLALQKEFADAYAAILARVSKEELESLTGEARIQREREIAIKELEILRENLIKKGQAEEDYEAKLQKRRPEVFKLNIEQEEQFNILKQNVFEKETEELIKLAVDRENKIAAARSLVAQQNETNLATEEENIIAAVNLQGKPVGMDGAAFERQKQKAILSIQSEFAMKRLELRRETLNAEREAELKGLNGELALLQDKNDTESELKRAQILESVKLLEDRFALEGIKIQDATAKIINDLQAEREKLVEEKKPFSLAAFLGITEKDLQNIQTTLDEVQKIFDSVLSMQLQQLEADLVSSKQREASAEQQIQSLESKLEAEEDLADRGKANNQDRIRAEIAQQEEALQREKDLQLKALEEKKKIQKQKLLVDSITQATNLITASSEILANTAKDPISLGIALGAVTAMIVGFGIAKAQALKAINSGNDPLNLAKGEIDIQGPGTETSDSIPANLSKGESVMTAKETRNYKDLLLGIRNNDKKQKEKAIAKMIKIEGLKNVLHSDKKTERVSVMQSLKEVLIGTGVTLPRELPQQLAGKRDAMQKLTVRSLFNNDFTALEAQQKATNQRLDKLIEGQERKEVVYTDNNATVIKKGNHITRIRK